MRLGLLPVLLAVVAAVVLMTQARAESPPPDRDAIRDIVREYLIEHAEVIEEAIRVLRERRKIERPAPARAAIAENAEALRAHPMSPVSGNPEGNVTVVEFFDFRCPDCQRALGPMMELLAADARVPVVWKEFPILGPVWKEFPILGPVSRFAARAAMAAHRQGLYHEFHVAVMGWPEKLTEAAVIEIAAGLKLDTGRFRQDIEDAAIEAYLEETAQLAQALGIGGTPAFVTGDTLVPGAVDGAGLMALVAQTRFEE